jgi:hypothetical protein
MSPTCAYEGVNGVNLSFIAQSFHRLLDWILSLASSSIDVCVVLVVWNPQDRRRQSSPKFSSSSDADSAVTFPGLIVAIVNLSLTRRTQLNK